MSTCVKRRLIKLPNEGTSKIENGTLATRIYAVSSSRSVCGLITCDQP
jgi:hypothetical protein